ncbi:DEAD/DEAH box helicase [Vibrio metoecus]|uniref:ATP-dependent helicase n=1 Tax=Vibrio metoecus TaxID=1481663 RepID=A0A271VR09_VIBMT|nr:DEAD/DEAH box helicase family protein [Vibrio metoecus]KQB10591.1 ATP-dependent helicase [Vibrio metoecus]PAR20511.1 ATP-dependent helicase [Vibrio metoecus]PAR22851.1 ATP-dependent helicase [Vibrio metoecus]
MTTNFVEVTYQTSSDSVNTNTMGMREMQARAYEARQSQYLLLKSPPASGKSRALMFIALDKMHNQHIKKTIIAVPEKSIGGSFSDTDLSTYGFFADWIVKKENNLCIDASDTSGSFKKFMLSGDDVLVCTHSTLRNSFRSLEPSDFNDCLIAIDEFHHLSANDDNILGGVLQALMNSSNAHIVAMTGSYFRGDAEPVLLPEYENRFDKVTYNYYEQLNGYKHLKSLGIGYHFYQGSYLSEIEQVLDTDKKTILHIPNVNSMESTGNKYQEVDHIIDSIGEIIDDRSIDPKAYDAGVIFVERKTDGKIIRVADLVNDNPKEREKIQGFLRDISSVDDMDLIIALGTAKEGFDWAYCEHSLTIGYRGSLTEIIQIIGRCTRDSENKTHAQFTNLIVNPDVSDTLIKDSVNNMLKAITCSLLMEQILEPRLNFRSPQSKENSDDSINKDKFDNDYKKEQEALKKLNEQKKSGTVEIKGFAEPSTDKVKQIIQEDMTELQAAVLQDNVMQKAMAGSIDAEVANRVHLPRIIAEKFKGLGLSDEEVEQIRQHFVAEALIKPSRIKEQKNADGSTSRFIEMANKRFDLDDLSIDLIDSCNIYENAFDVLSKSVDAPVLKAIKNEIDSQKITITKEEVLILFKEHKIEEFMATHQRKPSLESNDPLERRLAEAILFVEKMRQQHGR